MQHSALLQIFEQRGNRLVNGLTIFRVVFFQVGVCIPRTGRVAATTVINLYEPHTPFDKSTSGQQLPTVPLTVGVERRLRLILQVKDFGYRHLHTESQLIRIDSCSQRRIFRIFHGCQLVQLPDQLHVGCLFFLKDAPRGIAVRKRFFFVDHDTVMLGTQVVGQVYLWATATIRNRFAHHDKLRQVFIQTTQTIMHPGTNRGEKTITDVAARVKLKLRSVVVICCP